MKTNLHYTSLFIALALIWANAANADTAAGADTTASANNGWSVKVGINQITPHVTSGNMTALSLLFLSVMPMTIISPQNWC
jgi:hypothetical protein